MAHEKDLTWLLNTGGLKSSKDTSTMELDLVLQATFQ